jgi:hypothetical protein
MLGLVRGFWSEIKSLMALGNVRLVVREQVTQITFIQAISRLVRKAAIFQMGTCGARERHAISAKAIGMPQNPV